MPDVFDYLFDRRRKEWKKEEESFISEYGCHWGVVQCGGVLAVAGLGCYVMLLWALAGYMCERKVSAAKILFCITYLAGALLNTIAPGNYVRSGVIQEKIRPMKAVINTCLAYAVEMEWLLKDTLMAVCILILIVCGLLLYDRTRVRLKVYTVISVMALLAPAVEIFPVALGYGGAGLPNRCQFVVDLTMEVVLLNLAFAVGCIIRQTLEASTYKSVVVVAMLMIFCVACTSHYRLTGMVVLNLSRRLVSGTIQKYYKECNVILEYLDTCGEQDVVIKDIPKAIESFGYFIITEDKDNWINRAIADYYQKDSVRRE